MTKILNPIFNLFYIWVDECVLVQLSLGCVRSPWHSLQPFYPDFHLLSDNYVVSGGWAMNKYVCLVAPRLQFEIPPMKKLATRGSTG